MASGEQAKNILSRLRLGRVNPSVLNDGSVVSQFRIARSLDSARGGKERRKGAFQSRLEIIMRCVFSKLTLCDLCFVYRLEFSSPWIG